MYFKTDQKQIDFNADEVTKAYNEGYVLTRLGKGIVNQTRSLRINLDNFELNSENRRILRKTEGLELEYKKLPLEDYSWEIHKMGKEFYASRSNYQSTINNEQIETQDPPLATRNSVMSASKIKEMFNDMEQSNVNSVFTYKYQNTELEPVGYCLTYANNELLHYAYPFYDLEFADEMPNVGLGMMIRAIEWAKDNGKKYIYLGSVVDESAKYKLQFNGLEWFDGESNNWTDDLDKLKELL